MSDPGSWCIKGIAESMTLDKDSAGPLMHHGPSDLGSLILIGIMSILWHKTWSQPLKSFEQWVLTRGFLKQYLTEKQKGYIYKVVAYARWPVTRSGR